MDSFDFDNVKAEKLKALQRFNRFKTISRFFRVAEIFVALLFITWTLTRLPFALQIFVEFLRRIATVISTPLFVFLLGNSIVVVLLTKSSDQTTDVVTNAENEIYQAFVRSVENRSKPSDENVTEEIVSNSNSNSNLIAEEIVANSNSNSNLIAEEIVTDSNSNPIADEIDRDLSSDSISDQLKIYGRSKSDVSAKQSPRDSLMKRSLQRSETEKCREIEDENYYAEDNLSNEEFQKTIEDFIAKQKMFRRQESLAVVVHNKALI